MDSRLFNPGEWTRRTTLIALASVLFSCLAPGARAGTTFGIYDARTLAMGGASVASANNDNAQFYNAGLLAFNDEIEERTQDSRFLFPLIIPQAADSVITLETLTSNDETRNLSRAIGDFNAMPDGASAQAAFDATVRYHRSLKELEGQALFADVYLGLAISEPGRFQGAGFFIGSRLIASGQSSVTSTDLSTLAAYEEGLEFIATGGTQGVAHPELFDANGALLDPVDDLDSTASAIGAAITEAGVAMSRQIQLFGQPLAAGVSFKVQKVDTFEDAERIAADRIDRGQNSDLDNNINFDIGLVRSFGDNWRVGLAVKDIIPNNYNTSIGSVIRLRPRARLGTSYHQGPLQIAVDADLTQNEPLGDEQATQEVAIGAEWAVTERVRVRTGFRHDVRNARDDVVSIGAGTVWKRLALDVAYAAGKDAKAAALQFGIVF